MNPIPALNQLTPVDSSGRISLGKSRAGSLYGIVFKPDGGVILTPSVAIPERELWLHRNSVAMAMAMAIVETGLSEMVRGETVSIDLTLFPEDVDEK